ncbi:hypothetical protein, partial [Escherichia coli]|uniref:hypothetical protein n=1 Tax=Escherichia coli TaxID=562 RepID=UPI001F048B0D
LTALSAEFTIGEGELMAHDVSLGCAPDEYDDLISGTCSHLPYSIIGFTYFCDFISVYLTMSLSESVSRSDERSEWRQINSGNEPSR